jgi:hypothetical protein
MSLPQVTSSGWSFSRESSFAGPEQSGFLLSLRMVRGSKGKKTKFEQRHGTGKNAAVLILIEFVHG